MPVPENARELNPQLLQVVRHYRRCRAVGRFPIHPHGEDLLVTDHAAIIQDVERMAQETQFRRLELTLATAMGANITQRALGGE